MVFVALRLEDDFEEITKQFSCIFDVGRKESIETEILGVSESFKILNELLTHSIAVGSLVQILFPQVLEIDEVVFLVEQFADAIKAKNDCLNKSGGIEFLERVDIYSNLLKC